MKQLVIMPGGFHPFHAGHLALYQSAVEAFPGADVKVAATNDTSNRPFPFKLKEKLAQLAGVPPGDFYQVKSPFRADEITRNYDPADTQLIFVRSQKDADQPPIPGKIKKDGTPGYLQPVGDQMAPMTQHAYMAYLPTVEFGPGMRHASQIRTAWPDLTERQRTALVMSLYPNTQKNPKLANTVVKMLDTAMGTELTEVLDTKAGTSHHAHWNTSDPDMIKFNFTASNGVEYQLDFLAPYIGPENMSPYDYFDSDEVFDNSKFVSFEQLTNDIKGGHPVAKQGIEGTGSAAEVFGIVVHAIIQYVKKARPALLYFQAAESNRRALYARMIQRVLPSLPGWASMTVGNGEFGIYNKRAVKSAMGAEVSEATGDERFDSIMSRIRQEPTIPDPQMPPTDVKDLYHWAVKHHKPYHKIFAHWANREGYKSVAPALMKAGNLDSDAIDYWTPDVWKIWYGPESEMPQGYSRQRIPEELRDYLETVFDAYDRIVFDWPTEYLQIKENELNEDAVMGKIEQSGQIVRILKKQHTVPFSSDKDWLLIDTDPAKGNKGLGIKWVPATTRFEWVRPYRDTVDENFTNYQGVRPPKNVPGTNLFPGQDIVGQRVYHCTNRLEAIKKSGGLKPRRDATGEREYGRLSTDEHPFIPVIGIWFSVGKPDWPGKHCVSFVIEPTDQVYVAYANTKGLKPNVVLNPIALDRLTVEGQQDVAEEVTRQMSQGGLRASYQRKYNQPISEDYLDEARS